MEEGLLSLKWNNHKSTFFHVLSILREKHTYTDVTLACDGRLYPAHKFVLSTCSEYFSDIFTSTTGNNIVIVLKDVRRQDLEYLLDYMYLGQVDVAQSELSSLIKTAECLRIKGLAIPDDEPQKIPRRGPEERDHDGSPPSKKKRHLAEEERTSSISSNNTTCRIPHVALPPPLPPQSPQQQALLQRLQVPLPQPPQAPPTSQAAGKSHPSPLPHSLAPSQVPRTSQVPTSPHATTSTPQPHPPLSSPSQSTSLPVIKQEVADPPETPEVFMNESYEETETKPDVSDSRHMEQDVAIAGPSGLQGSSDNWDGDNDLASFAGGEGYSEGGIEEQGDSEVQGGPRSRDCPLGDAEDFLRRLEDKPHTQERLLAPAVSGSSASSSSDAVGGVFPSTTTLASPTISFSSQHLFPSSSNCSTSTSICVNSNGSSRLTDSSSSSLICSFCSYIARNVRELVTHRQTHHWDHAQQRQQAHSKQPVSSRMLTSEEREQKVFKCPYCNVQAKGRSAIENHVINHSAGEEGPDRLYWCSFCTLKCRSAPGLSSHKKRHEYQGDC